MSRCAIRGWCFAPEAITRTSSSALYSRKRSTRICQDIEWSGSGRIVGRLEVPLFPGYVFVQPRLDQLEKVRRVPGSCGFVVQGSQPAVMPQKELDAVRILAGSGADLTVTRWLILWQRVEVIAGPFMGVQGQLIRIKSQDRLLINAWLVSRSVSVDVYYSEIEIIQDSRARKI